MISDPGIFGSGVEPEPSTDVNFMAIIFFFWFKARFKFLIQSLSNTYSFNDLFKKSSASTLISVKYSVNMMNQFINATSNNTNK